MVGVLAQATYAAGHPIDAAAVAVVARNEIKAGRLHMDSKTCLGVDGDRDPSDLLLRDLRRAGLSFRKASRCRQPPNGMMLTVTSIKRAGSDRLMVDVEVSNMAIEPGEHFATILANGTYTLVKAGKTGWSIERSKSQPR